MKRFVMCMVLVAMTCGFASGLTGCAAKQQDEAAYGASEEWRLRSLEENFLDFKEEQRQNQEKLRRQKADMEKKLIEYEAKIAELETAIAQQEIQGMEKKQAALAAATMAPVSTDASTSESDSTGMKVVPAASVTPASSGDAAPAPKPAPVNYDGMSAKELYDRAVKFALDEKYSEARPLLEKVLSDYPKSPLVPNALYWLGETYYDEERFGQAILTFKEVTRRFPDHHKAADALLKIGYSYAELGDNENAAFYLQALVDEYPKADCAPKARARLNALQ